MLSPSFSASTIAFVFISIHFPVALRSFYALMVRVGDVAKGVCVGLVTISYQLWTKPEVSVGSFLTDHGGDTVGPTDTRMVWLYYMVR